MKKAWIAVNHFLNTEKFKEHYMLFDESAKKHNIKLSLYTNLQIISGAYEYIPDFVLFWDKDIRIAKLLESKGIRLFNSATATEASDDKYITYLKLTEKGIPVPETIIAPMTYYNIGYNDFKFIDDAAEKLGYPMIIKEVFGSFGQQVYLAQNKNEAQNIIMNTNCRPVLFQKFIAESAGKDIRINVIGNKAAAAIMRTNDNDFRANLSIGGHALKYIPDPETEKLAVAAANALGLDFGGVDLLFDNKNGFSVCEVNSNAHFKNMLKVTGINIADKIFEYIGEQL